MIRSMDTLQKSFNILQKKQENTSSNVSNVNTFGFKSQKIIQKTDKEKQMFNHLKGPQLNDKNEIGTFIFGNRIDEINKNMTTGSMKQTNKQTDYAILGDGFFNIQLANGTIGYTKNGHFQVNEQNQLVTQEGYLVLSDNGQPVDARQQNPNFRLTKFNDLNNLTAIGESLFSGVNGEQDLNSRVENHMLESSNVDMVDEMTDLLQTAREFEINQKALHTSDETLRKLTNEIGRV
ncbi:flagellar hook-basal body protein [Vagococcus fluvialis]|uniref:Flagellar hook-basal body protein n=1 Tax=Vagococcus fluvialis TaxID=2738 RepID=A0A369ATF9_9ENTE|nr:flagellar hook-basal body protein [Vagococcus fluvialis]MDR2278761.1 flagellar hook-basal body protein [Vagococcus sp.]MBO0443385.1 flagellar hook-basal body protein [Vagococcus fluvialis]MBO0485853.1 flagellar hook-basal body protein [Vagococcus fluvialis]MCM2137816.1 flagellar hook-basal body protein [Vagococcus fluvialis]MDT2747884.1 flagellar hook-basal body protein [Vagococcus fluvialis]